MPCRTFSFLCCSFFHVCLIEVTTSPCWRFMCSSKRSHCSCGILVLGNPLVVTPRCSCRFIVAFFVQKWLRQETPDFSLRVLASLQWSDLRDGVEHAEEAATCSERVRRRMLTGDTVERCAAKAQTPVQLEGVSSGRGAKLAHGNQNTLISLPNSRGNLHSNVGPFLVC